VVRAALSRDDDYTAAGKPVCGWDDPAVSAYTLICRLAYGLTWRSARASGSVGSS